MKLLMWGKKQGSTHLYLFAVKFVFIYECTKNFFFLLYKTTHTQVKKRHSNTHTHTQSLTKLIMPTFVPQPVTPWVAPHCLWPLWYHLPPTPHFPHHCQKVTPYQTLASNYPLPTQKNFFLPLTSKSRSIWDLGGLIFVLELRPKWMVLPQPPDLASNFGQIGK